MDDISTLRFEMVTDRKPFKVVTFHFTWFIYRGKMALLFVFALDNLAPVR